MKTEKLKIENIPAALWGDCMDRLFIGVHGQKSNKLDFEDFADAAVGAGFGLLTFDLPEHGERADDPTPWKPQYVVPELTRVLEKAKTYTEDISLYTVSAGTFFSLGAFENETFSRAIMLSPVVDMRLLIGNLMLWSGTTEEKLRAEQTVVTDFGQTLYWDFYCWVNEHPVTKWNTPTAILSGSNDDIAQPQTVSAFAERFGCSHTVLQGGSHRFNAPEERAFARGWYAKQLGKQN